MSMARLWGDQGKRDEELARATRPAGDRERPSGRLCVLVDLALGELR
jgi:hypothetical protein